jgi:D-alanine--poly(phosphoribitol) ligase subunit 1
VVSAGRTISYRELQHRANAVAAGLGAASALAGDRVGIFMGRSPELIVAILGAMYAGAVCVPLDISYPSDSLMVICRDADIRYLATDDGQAGTLDGFAPVAQVASMILAKCARVAASEPGRGTPGAAQASAYIMYTSGSTGAPKGVLMSHEALARMVAWQIADSGCGAGYRTLQFAPASFDIAIQEIFGTLCAGGTLVCCSDEQRLDPDELASFLIQEGIHRLYIPPVLLQGLASYAREALAAKQPVLREVISGGEALQCTQPIRELFESIPDCRLINHYGATEVLISTRYRLPADVAAWPDIAPLGFPVAGGHTHIANESGVQADGAGELVVAGPCVGQGYWRRPGETARQFIADPCARARRAYRTGDLVRLGMDGMLWHEGRIDAVVKVRGARVDLHGVEVVLNSAPGVAGCVVVVLGDGMDERLAALVVPTAIGLSTEAIYDELTRKIPALLIPSVIKQTTSLPRTPSGKLDRRAAARLLASGDRLASPEGLTR